MELNWVLAALLAVVFGLPLLGALVMAGFGPRRHPCLGWWAFAASALSAAAALVLLVRVGPEGSSDLNFVWVADQGLGLHLRLDPLGLLLLAVVTVLTSLAVLYSVPHHGPEGGTGSF
ncbi:MAG: hypothetical protein K6T75_05605, partial [Acetobacteraceae bacterium]|nr:hypothetical protein [Acetobacteraceae bacterium]